MRSIFLYFSIIVFNSGYSQVIPRVMIKGAVKANSHDLEGIYVINLKTEKATITEKEGYFFIDAIPGDTLIFSAIHLKELRIGLTQDDFQKELLVVKMELRVNQLNEVLVRRYDKINAVSLGISPAGIKHLTQAERKFATASSSKLNPMGLDPILNFLSGRTAMLKKELEVENKLSYIRLIDNMFDENHFRKNLKIPSEYINGFKYYMVENVQFANVLKHKNKTTIEFLLGELAIKYLAIIQSEN